MNNSSVGCSSQLKAPEFPSILADIAGQIDRIEQARHSLFRAGHAFYYASDTTTGKTCNPTPEPDNVLLILKALHGRLVQEAERLEELDRHFMTLV